MGIVNETSCHGNIAQVLNITFFTKKQKRKKFFSCLFDCCIVLFNFFGAAHGDGGGGGPLEKRPHISNNDETWHSYNLPEEDPKNV